MAAAMVRLQDLSQPDCWIRALTPRFPATFSRSWHQVPTTLLRQLLPRRTPVVTDTTARLTRSFVIKRLQAALVRPASRPSTAPPCPVSPSSKVFERVRGCVAFVSRGCEHRLPTESANTVH